MRNRWLLATAIMALLSLPLPLAHAATPGLETIYVPSTALGRDVPVNVLLPADYRTAPHRRYPVLYMLHGAGDTYAAWVDNTDIEEAVRPFDLIVVMPDAGHGPDAGWYSDWRDGPAWESFHIGELVPFIDQHFRTIPNRSGRGIAGLSMGGFGAMSYAARHPDLFAAAASFSGAVDTTLGGPAEAAAFGALHDQLGTPDRRVWGDYATDEVNWRAHNPPDLSTNLRWTNLWLSTGNGVPQPGDRAQDAPTEAGVYALNLSFHRDLESEGIAHTWLDRGRGTHSWRYWQDDLHLVLPWFAGLLGAALPPPTVFDYRSAEPAFSVYEWRFVADPLRAQEFLDLFGVSRDGFRVRGSGLLSVTTAPLFVPGAAYTVSQHQTVIADPNGRLHFVVDLGPPHTQPQYTPAARLAEVLEGPAYWRDVAVSITPASRHALLRRGERPARHNPGRRRNRRSAALCGPPPRPSTPIRGTGRGRDHPGTCTAR